MGGGWDGGMVGEVRGDEGGGGIVGEVGRGEEGKGGMVGELGWQ